MAFHHSSDKLSKEFDYFTLKFYKSSSSSTNFQRFPRCWNIKDRSKSIRLSQFALTVTYSTGFSERHESSYSAQEAACVRADSPISLTTGIYYFEVTLVNKGTNGVLSIGLSTKTSSLSKFPGSEFNSFGYHMDGCVYHGSPTSSTKFGPRICENDTVGCGIDFMSKSMFFTRNGIFLGRAFEGTIPVTSATRLYPTVGLQGKGMRLTTNFGQLPFQYEFENHIKNERLNRENMLVERICKEEFTGPKMKELVSGYLVHHGYVATAKTFSNWSNLGARVSSGELNQKVENKAKNNINKPIHSCSSDTDFDLSKESHNSSIQRRHSTASSLDGTSSTVNQLPGIESMLHRRQLRALCRHCQYGKAASTLNKLYPQVFERCPELLVQLRCRQLIEMMHRHAVRRGHSSINSNNESTDSSTPSIPPKIQKINSSIHTGFGCCVNNKDLDSKFSNRNLSTHNNKDKSNALLYADLNNNAMMDQVSKQEINNQDSSSFDKNDGSFYYGEDLNRIDLENGDLYDVDIKDGNYDADDDDDDGFGLDDDDTGVCLNSLSNSVLRDTMNDCLSNGAIADQNTRTVFPDTSNNSMDVDNNNSGLDQCTFRTESRSNNEVKHPTDTPLTVGSASTNTNTTTTNTIISTSDNSSNRNGTGTNNNNNNISCDVDEMRCLLRHIQFGRSLVNFVKKVRAKTGGLSLETERLLQQSVSLLAYPSPTSADCPLRGLLDPVWRDTIASIINSAVLKAHDLPAQPALEQSLRMLQHCFQDRNFVESQTLGHFLFYHLAPAQLLKVNDEVANLSSTTVQFQGTKRLRSVSFQQALDNKSNAVSANASSSSLSQQIYDELNGHNSIEKSRSSARRRHRQIIGRVASPKTSQIITRSVQRVEHSSNDEDDEGDDEEEEEGRCDDSDDDSDEFDNNDDDDRDAAEQSSRPSTRSSGTNNSSNSSGGVSGSTNDPVETRNSGSSNTTGGAVGSSNRFRSHAINQMHNRNNLFSNPNSPSPNTRLGRQTVFARYYPLFRDSVHARLATNTLPSSSVLSSNTPRSTASTRRQNQPVTNRSQIRSNSSTRSLTNDQNLESAFRGFLSMSYPHHVGFLAAVDDALKAYAGSLLLSNDDLILMPNLPDRHNSNGDPPSPTGGATFAP